ncbi:MAG: sulfatase [Bacteroidales bacterium]
MTGQRGVSLRRSKPRMTNFYAAQAVSSASRAGLMTGCYPNRIGITGALNHTARHGIAEGEMTIAELLKQQGYATGMVGKWHLGHLTPFLPLQNGFDDFLGLPYSNDMWPVRYDGYDFDTTLLPARLAIHPRLPLISNNDTLEYIESLAAMDQLTRRYTERAVGFIRKHADRPFFLYFAHTMVHTPLAASEEFRGRSRQGLFGDVMLEVDWSVGEIVETLRKHRILDNTLIIFTSDNGPWLNFGAHAGSTAGLREGKGTSFEGGMRVPCIISWPAVVGAGEVTGQLASTIDILPTLASITRTSIPLHTIDGVDISCILKGDFEAEPRNTFYYYYSRNSLEAVRLGQWKLVLPHPHRSYQGVLPKDDGRPGPYAHVAGELALYDLRRDPGEDYNVIDLYPEVLDQLLTLAETARADLGDDLTGRACVNCREPGKIR